MSCTLKLFILIACYNFSCVANAQVELRQIHRSTDVDGVVSAFAFSPNGRMLLAGAQQIRVLDGKTYAPVSPVLPGKRGVADAAFTYDSDRFVIARGRGPLEFWSTSSWAKEVSSTDVADFWNVECHPDRQECIASGAQSTIFRFSTTTGQLLASIKTEFQTVNGIQMMPDGKRFVSSGNHEDQTFTIELRDTTTLQVLATVQSGKGVLGRMTVTDDGRTLFGCTRKGHLQRWDLQQEPAQRTGSWQLDQMKTREVIVSANGQYAFVGGYGRKLKILNLNTDEISITSIPQRSGISALCMNPQGNHLLYAPGQENGVFRFAVSAITEQPFTADSTRKGGESQSELNTGHSSMGGMSASQDLPAKVSVILFCPKGVQPPPDYQVGIDRLAEYADRFLLDGVKKWEYSPAVETLFRRKDGHVEVFHSTGDKSSKAYTNASLHKEVIANVTAEHKFKPKSHVWWVLVYLGEPPLQFEDFKGGWSSDYVGWAVANYDPRLVELRPNMPIGSDLLSDMALKGIIHELGHAFRLPHIGPRYRLRRGNTLMGPTHANLRRVTGKVLPDAYVSEAAAAILASHPVFEGRPLKDLKPPRLRLSKVKVATNRRTKSVSVSGQVAGDQKPLVAILADRSTASPSEYWVRYYVSPVDPDGRYQIQISEPLPAGGEYWIWFVFPNGAITGNGRVNGAGEWATKKIPYRFRIGRWEPVQ
ncbi:MAG: hypothetical protein ABJZ55_07130 [Fuerstiella sp.]